MRRDDLYLLLDAGPNGQDGNGGHAHNDTLSFELFVYGKAFIIDPGSYVYTADYRARNLFRSTAYHNTVVVDGQEQNHFEENHLFSMGDNALTTIHCWQNTPEYDFFDAEHSGYQRLAQPVTHRRQVYFDKVEGWWIIRDLLGGEGSHQLQWNFHFAPEFVDRVGYNEGVVYTQTGAANLALLFSLEEPVQPTISAGWISHRYGLKQVAPIVSYTLEETLPLTRIILLWPFRGKAPSRLELTRLADEVVLNRPILILRDVEAKARLSQIQ
jgi:uncharacterized heparinase superfamily protein